MTTPNITNETCSKQPVDTFDEIIKNHLSLPYRTRDANLENLRKRLRDQGFYLLTEDQKAEILRKAKI